LFFAEGTLGGRREEEECLPLPRVLRNETAQDDAAMRISALHAVRKTEEGNFTESRAKFLPL
jgi:hypothetical protein